MLRNVINLADVRLYIDPATTSYIIQIIAGIVIAAGASIGIFWSKIKRALFSRKNSSTETEKSNTAVSAGENTGKVIKAEDLLDDED